MISTIGIFSNEAQSYDTNFINGIDKVEQLEIENCFGFALLVYDAAYDQYGDSSFAYDMMISAFNACSPPQ